MIWYGKTRDWLVHSNEDEQVQQDWILTKEGAINYALKISGVWRNDEYQRAPDRC